MDNISDFEHKRAQLVVDEMNAAVFEWNLKSNKFYSSNAFQKYAISNANPKDILNNSASTEYVHPDDYNVMMKFFAESESGAERIEQTMRLKMIDGSYRWCRVIGMFFKDKNGAPCRTLGIIIDVNDEHEKSYMLNKLINEIPGGVGIYEIIDGNVSLIYLNDAYYNILGLNRNERKQYFGSNALEAVYPDDKNNMIAGIKKIVDGADKISLLHRICNYNGEWIWINLVASVVERKNNYLRIYASFSDCNDMIRVQEELHNRYEDQVRYSRLASASSVASSMVNLTTNTITLQNSEDDKIMDVITQQTPQQGFESMYDCIPDEEISNKYKSIFDCKTIIDDFQKGITHKSIRHPYMTTDSWLLSSYNAVRNPKTGDLEVYCSAKDITKEELQKEISELLVSSSYEQAMIINAATGEPKVITDSTNGRVYKEQKKAQDYNIGLENYILKYSADENPKMVSYSVGLVAVKKALQSKKIYSVDYSVYDDKKIIHKRVSYSYLNKYKDLLFCTVQDITSAFEKESEQRNALKFALNDAEKANKAKSLFLSRMSHDMRTPLNGIIGMTALAMDNNNPKDTDECLNKINISSEFLLGLINDVLDMERIESEKTVLNLSPYSGEEFVRYVEAVILPLCKLKNINFKYTYSGSNDFVIIQDRLQINRIFLNLLSNAVKFTKDGGNILFHTDINRKNDSVILDSTISDDGIGMSNEFQKYMFEPFTQENQTIVPERKGSGLGLAIVKKMCDLMGIIISVESELGKGTTIYIHGEYKLAETADLSKAVEIDAPETTSMFLKNKRILVCEDHPLNQEIIKRILEKKGAFVVVAENGEAGVSYFKNSEIGYFDLILMDVRMPVMDGLEAAKTIRFLKRGDANSVPIIALTANAYDEDVKNCLDVGMNTHLAKPVNPEKLYAALSEYINK